ncbi:hypothetical protein DPMN_129548 [Dreissena polymorpha]|uniref:Uncharacterized protein n=1 Tax=Dreissena polymorpha TaxID=45954 RepID=A0A9D4H604_DREPO|nr:hypothetical protein DPMN_129548 [Dreissena polymorpha]
MSLHRLPSGELHWITRVPMISSDSLLTISQEPDVVEREAVAAVQKLGGDVTCRQHVLEQNKIQFGKDSRLVYSGF